MIPMLNLIESPKNILICTIFMLTPEYIRISVRILLFQTFKKDVNSIKSYEKVYKNVINFFVN